MKAIQIISSLAFALVMTMLVGSVPQVPPALAYGVGTVFASYGVLGTLGIIPMPANSLCVNFGMVANTSFPDLDGREAMGGYTAIAYLAFASDIETWPTEPNVETVTTVEGLVKLLGSFAFKEGKHFIEVMVKPGSAQFQPEGQGEVAGKSFKPKGQFFVPGIDAKSMGIARLMNNKYGVIILPDPDGKTRVQIGSKLLPCEFKPTADSGQKAADAKGFTYTFEADSFAPGWVYEGSITLSGSVVLPGVS